MRILYLTSAFPYPLFAGHLRYWHFMRELGRRHHVTLFSLTGADFRPEHADAMRDVVAEVRTFRRRDADSPGGRFLKEDLRLFWAVDPGMREMRDAVAAEVAEGRVDVVVMAGKRVFPAARDVSVPVVADVCDAESVRFRSRLEHASWREKPKVLLGLRTLLHMEHRVLARADRSLFASPRDRDALLAPNDPRAVIVPNGVDTGYWQRGQVAPTDPALASLPADARVVVFTGAMHYRPNADAALLLARNIFPLVRRQCPNAWLFLVGRDPVPSLKAMNGTPGVVVTGQVDDVRPYLERACVFGAPLRYASGIQNKVLEAMAMELPVVTTPAAANGLYTADGEAAPIEVVERPEPFAEALQEHVLQKAKRRVPVEETRRFVERHFSWAGHAATLEGVLQAAVEMRR